MSTTTTTLTENALRLALPVLEAVSQHPSDHGGALYEVRTAIAAIDADERATYEQVLARIADDGCCRVSSGRRLRCQPAERQCPPCLARAALS